MIGIAVVCCACVTETLCRLYIFTLIMQTAENYYTLVGDCYVITIRLLQREQYYAGCTLHKQDHSAGYCLTEIFQAVSQPLEYVVSQGVFTALLISNYAGCLISCPCVCGVLTHCTG